MIQIQNFGLTKDADASVVGWMEACDTAGVDIKGIFTEGAAIVEDVADTLVKGVGYIAANVVKLAS